jgi:hypothetical protein
VGEILIRIQKAGENFALNMACIALFLSLLLILFQQKLEILPKRSYFITEVRCYTIYLLLIC